MSNFKNDVFYETQLYVYLKPKDYYLNKKNFFDRFLDYMKKLFEKPENKKNIEKISLNEIETSLDNLLEDLNKSERTDKPIKKFLFDFFNRYINALSFMDLDALAISIASGRFSRQVKYEETKLKYEDNNEIWCHVHTNNPSAIKEFFGLLGDVDVNKSFIGYLEGTEEEKSKNLFNMF